ncbi:hypothetical protein D3C84_1044230 [compost metagenome]
MPAREMLGLTTQNSVLVLSSSSVRGSMDSTAVAPLKSWFMLMLFTVPTCTPL